MSKAFLAQRRRSSQGRDGNHWIWLFRAGHAARCGCLLCCLLLMLAGCTSKKKAGLQAREAFLAGQEQALARMGQPHEPSVTVVGEVRNPVLPWAEDLTLAKALIAADYFGRTDPRRIVVVRNGRALAFDPRQLLSGHDMPLEPGDVVQLSR